MDNSPLLEITDKMFSTTKNIRTMSYSMKKQERINGVLQMQETDTKLQLEPFKVYLIQQAPKKGLEVLYVEGSNNNKALIKPNGFPWVNVHLDPMGSTMRKNQHHTLYYSGYNHVVSILEFLFDKYKDEISTMVKVRSVRWNDQLCWEIEFNNPHFHFYEYTVQEGENILDIAKRNKLSEYMILERNKLSDYSSIKAGQKIQLPNDYSPKMLLMIEKDRTIPLLMKVYDDLGLFQQYEYTNVVLNPKFDPAEFTKEYRDYGF